MIQTTEFYFIRHGQTDFNIRQENIDHKDPPINATGRKQAASIEPIIAKLPIKTICSSPLKRAQETKTIISPRLTVAHHDIPDLRECSLETWIDMTANPSKIYQEDVLQFIQQTKSGLYQALAYNGPVLIVAHGGIHYALCHLLNIHNHNWIIDNCLPVHFVQGQDQQWHAKTLI